VLADLRLCYDWLFQWSLNSSVFERLLEENTIFLWDIAEDASSSTVMEQYDA